MGGTADMRPAITHCLFDMDGLLLDTETLYSVAQQQILDRFGLQFTWELKAKMMGKRALEAGQVLIDELHLTGKMTAEQFVTEREELLDKLFPSCALMPGVERLIRHLAAHKVPIAVATSSHRRHYDLKTSGHNEIFSLFDHVITGDQATKGKPDPQIFNLAAATFQTPPSSPAHCLVFEDAPSGVAAALAAGMQCVHVPDPNLKLDLESDAAHQVLQSLQAFDPIHWGLPGYT